jgi:hypothetical protein
MDDLLKQLELKNKDQLGLLIPKYKELSQDELYDIVSKMLKLPTPQMGFFNATIKLRKNKDYKKFEYPAPIAGIVIRKDEELTDYVFYKLQDILNDVEYHSYKFIYFNDTEYDTELFKHLKMVKVVIQEYVYFVPIPNRFQAEILIRQGDVKPYYVYDDEGVIYDTDTEFKSSMLPENTSTDTIPSDMTEYNTYRDMMDKEVNERRNNYILEQNKIIMENNLIMKKTKLF